MRADVAQRSGPGPVPLQPPDQRELRIGDPVLEVHRPYVTDVAESAVADQAAQVRHGGHPAVVETAHCPHPLGPRGRRRLGHGAGLQHGVGQRLLAQHVFAGGQRRQRDLRVTVPRRTDIDQVDIVTGHQVTPVGHRLRPTQPIGGGRHLDRVPPGDSHHPGPRRQVKDPIHGTPRLRMGRSHERVPDHADPNIHRCHHYSSSISAGSLRARGANVVQRASASRTSPWVPAECLGVRLLQQVRDGDRLVLPGRGDRGVHHGKAVQVVVALAHRLLAGAQRVHEVAQRPVDPGVGAGVERLDAFAARRRGARRRPIRRCRARRWLATRRSTRFPARRCTSCR